MSLNDEKVSKLIEAIQAEARQRQEQIKREIDELTRLELEQAEAEVLGDAYALIHNEMNSMEQGVNRDFSQKQVAARRELIGLRQETKQKVFALAREKLSFFTEGDQYLDFLIQSAQSIAGVLGDGAFILYVRPADLQFEDHLKAQCPNAAVIVSDDIAIGGMTAVSSQGGQVIDDTLDARLQEQEPWFLEHCVLGL